MALAKCDFNVVSIRQCTEFVRRFKVETLPHLQAACRTIGPKLN